MSVEMTSCIPCESMNPLHLEGSLSLIENHFHTEISSSNRWVLVDREDSKKSKATFSSSNKMDTCCICEEQSMCFVCSSGHPTCHEHLERYIIDSYTSSKHNLRYGDVVCPGVCGTTKCPEVISFIKLLQAGLPKELLANVNSAQTRHEQEKIEQLKRLSAPELTATSVATASNPELTRFIRSIQDKLVLDVPYIELDCPHCLQPYTIPFEGPDKFSSNECARLTCSSCSEHFCAWCIGKCPKDSAAAHEHVRYCRENKRPGPPSISADVEGDFTIFIEHHKSKKAAKAKASYKSLSNASKMELQNIVSKTGHTTYEVTFTGSEALGLVIDDYHRKVRVKELVKGGKAADLGINKGDLIVSINGSRISSTDEFADNVKSRPLVVKLRREVQSSCGTNITNGDVIRLVKEIDRKLLKYIRNDKISIGAFATRMWDTYMGPKVQQKYQSSCKEMPTEECSRVVKKPAEESSRVVKEPVINATSSLSWACSWCTLINGARVQVCEICGHSRNNINPDYHQEEKIETPFPERIHHGISCDLCAVNPSTGRGVRLLTGIRFKCLGRSNYDLCEKCEKKESQPFPMVKIYDPDQWSHEYTRALDAARSESLSHEQKQILQTIARKGTHKGNLIHRHVTCDECHVSPIVGLRFKCLGRDDYDLCEKCEKKNRQPFPMLKMYESYG